MNQIHQEWKEDQATEAMRRLLLSRAAPMMLAALKITAENMRAFHSGDDNVMYLDWINQVEQAIDLAEGRV